MSLTKHTFSGQLGKTVIYSINNLQIETANDFLSWASWRFYTPVGQQTDEEGQHYFDVAACQIPIQREERSYNIIVTVTRDEGIVVYKIYEGEEPDRFSIGLEGDSVLDGFIPSSPDEEISITYYEVTDEN